MNNVQWGMENVEGGHYNDCPLLEAPLKMSWKTLCWFAN